MAFEIERHKHGRPDAVFQAIRRAVAVEHDLNVDAIVLLRAGSVPKTSSGKIQRHACRQGYLDGTLQVVGQWRSGADGGLRGEVRGAAVERASAAAGLGPPAAATAASKNGDRAERPSPAAPVEPPPAAGGPPKKLQTAQLVLEEIRRVAKERAAGMTLDSPIAEAGLDSLERMEILATLEERLGGRFPQAILLELETTRQVIDAAEKYLGSEPRHAARGPGRRRDPARTVSLRLLPRICPVADTAGAGATARAWAIRISACTRGLPTTGRWMGGRELINFASYNYVGTSGDKAVSQAAKEAIDRYGTSVSASRLASGEKVLHGELERGLSQFLGTEAALTFVGGHATNETVIGHVVGPGDLVLHDALAHNSIVQGRYCPAPGGGPSPITTPRPPTGCWSSSGTSTAAC